MTQKQNLVKATDSLDKLILAQKSLEEAVALPIVHPRDLAGIIQSFEFVFELTWKTLKRLLEIQGHDAGSARDVFKMAFKIRFLSEEDIWLKILDARNETSHTYSKALAENLVRRINAEYVAAFRGIVDQIQSKISELA